MEKLEALKVGEVQREEKKKNVVFYKLETLFFFLLFFHYCFSFALQR